MGAFRAGKVQQKQRQVSCRAHTVPGEWRPLNAKKSFTLKAMSNPRCCRGVMCSVLRFEGKSAVAL